MTVGTLGRRVQHDPESRLYPARSARPQNTLWAHHAPVLDQFYTGACTGFALAQCLNTVRFGAFRPGRRYLTAKHALQLYSLATELDDMEGTYPPDDTGSSGLAVCKAGKRLGYFAGYRHAFGFDHFAAALAISPVIVGTYWHDSMSQPDTRNIVRVTGKATDGHEYLALGINYATKLVTFLNSWGDGFGDHGRFHIPFPDFADLLERDGDVTVPTL